MTLNEIKIGSIYRTTLKVEFRSKAEVKEVDFFVRVTGKTSGDFVEINFLNDNICHFLLPCQIERVE